MSATSELLTPYEAARYLRRDEATLKWWRSVGRGPVFVRQENGRVFYLVSDLDDYLGSQRIDPRQQSVRR